MKRRGKRCAGTEESAAIWQGGQRNTGGDICGGRAINHVGEGGRGFLPL